MYGNPVSSKKINDRLTAFPSGAKTMVSHNCGKGSKPGVERDPSPSDSNTGPMRADEPPEMNEYRYPHANKKLILDMFFT